MFLLIYQVLSLFLKKPLASKLYFPNHLSSH
nr:MAG TPA: hypothetical protein [Caudoviricetes sp.]